MDDVTINNLLCYHIKQIDSVLPWVSTVIDQISRQNATFLFLTHFDVICHLLLIMNRRMATLDEIYLLTRS